MIQNQLKLLPLTDIQVPRESRQRTELTPESIYPLACSIARDGLLHNIGVTAESHTIIFGERRFTAFQLLNAIHNNIKTPLDDDKVYFLLNFAPEYDGYTKIPVRLCKGADSFTHYALEFIENTHREDLPWQDRSKAALELHRRARKEKAASGELWTEAKTAELLSITPATFNGLIKPLIEAETASSELKAKITQAIKDSPSPLSASKAAATIKERHGELPATRAGKAAGLVKRNTKPTAPIPEPDPDDSPIIHDSFITWAESYSGPPFNFIHCDFPYGIDFNKSAGQSTSAATKSVGQYDDGVNVYWSLLDALLHNRDKLLTDSAHIMFWYSQNLDDQTRQAIAASWPDAVVSSFRLIWHCSDSSGLCPAPEYEGRRNYETAFQITLGKRKIAKPKDLCFASPRNEKKIHRSQKHLPVLQHFFQQYVDESTIMLDPTCGSATSLIAARYCGAKHLVGIERDEEMVGLARKHYADQTS